jgi:hypothetical protein
MSDSPRPLGPLILLIVGVLVAMAVFWVGFMLAPAAVLLISYLALSAGERGRHQRQPSSESLELPAATPGVQPPAGPGGRTDPQPGAQLGARRSRAAGVRRSQESDPSDPTESDLVEAGSATSQSRGAQAL